MVREIKVSADTITVVKEAIYALRHSEDFLVLRGGGCVFQKEQWIDILTNTFQLVPDRRHFDPAWAAAEALRRWKLERSLAGSADVPLGQSGLETAETDLDLSAQLAPADWWEVSYQPDRAAAYSYSNTRQPMHTDNAWFADPSEINFFIMERQVKSGGEQTIYPLSRLIADLAAEQPALLSDLCEVPVIIKKGDGGFFNHTSIIVLGDEPVIFWNYYRTEKPTREIEAMCESFFKYLESKESTSSVERVRCESGDCFCFNDQKMVHGRTAFAATIPFERVLLQSMWRLPE